MCAAENLAVAIGDLGNTYLNHDKIIIIIIIIMKLNLDHPIA
jgi:hypothetical protein